MRKLIEKNIISAFCLYNAYKLRPNIDLAFYFLISIIISTLLDLFLDLKSRIGIYIIFVFLIFLYPTYIYFLPLVLYNFYLDFKTYALIALIFVLKDFSIMNLLLISLSIYLASRSCEFDLFTYTNKKVRDELKEDANYLIKYNEQLKIDKEKDIHIAVLTERNRIAREIHDSIGHTISSSILQVEALKIISDNNTTESLKTLQNTLNTGMNEIRDSIHDLHRDSFDLNTKIEELILDLKNYHVEYIYKLDSNLSYNIKFDILSIIKEGITNIIKHSKGNKIKLNLISQIKFHTIILKDNGDFINNVNSLHTKGIGLNSMREIADKYQGFLNYKYDNGFTIQITLMKG